MKTLIVAGVIFVLVVVIPVAIWGLFYISGTMAKIDDAIKEELD